MVDVEQVIFEYLDTSGNALHTLIGDNLFVDTTHGFDGSLEKGLRFRVKGGTTGMYAPLNNPIVDFFCYGGSDTIDDSRAVYRALNDRLHSITNTETESGFIIGSYEIVQGQNLVEPDTNWRYTFTTYQFSIRSK